MQRLWGSGMCELFTEKQRSRHRCKGPGAAACLTCSDNRKGARAGAKAACVTCSEKSKDPGAVACVTSEKSKGAGAGAKVLGQQCM